MGKSTLHVLTRRPNGQVGYISDALEIPEFVDLIRNIGGRPDVLVDYSPVIKALHTLYSKGNDEATLNQFNSLFNFWQEAKSYKKPAYRLEMSLTLTERCNEFICGLQTRLQKKESGFYSALNETDRLKVTRSIKQDADMYIIALLCFIHSKAALEIESFQEETVITSYGEFLSALVGRLYRWHLPSGDASNSFLRYLAFEYSDMLPVHLALLAPSESEDEFLLRTLREQKPYVEYDQIDGRPVSWRAVKIIYDPPSSDFFDTADILKDLMFRARSVCEFILRLKQPGVSWDESADAIQALTEEVHYTGPLRLMHIG